MTLNSPSHFEASAEPLAQRITTGLVKVGLALKSRAQLEAGRHRMSPTQGQILAFLRLRPNQGATLSAVAQGLAITPGTACGAVRTLEKKVLVRKVRSKFDARRVTITLSAKGRRKAEQTANWPTFLIAVADTLTSPEQEVFLGALMKIIRALEKRGDIPVSSQTQDTPQDEMANRKEDLQWSNKSLIASGRSHCAERMTSGTSGCGTDSGTGTRHRRLTGGNHGS